MIPCVSSALTYVLFYPVAYHYAFGRPCLTELRMPGSIFSFQSSSFSVPDRHHGFLLNGARYGLGLEIDEARVCTMIVDYGERDYG